MNIILFIHKQAVVSGQQLVLEGPALLSEFQLQFQHSPPLYYQLPDTEPPCPLQRSITVTVNSSGG